MSGLNFIVTVVKLRAPGMTWFRMPLFVWSSLVVGWLMILAMPAIAVTLLEVFLERHFGFTFFGPAHGGDPILYQHLFWFFGHPEVYILIMPAFGIISEIIPVFSRKPVFGYKLMAWSMILIAFLSFLLWAHHMFSSGMDPRLSLPFMILTMIIGVPTGVKMFNWMATMWRGKLYLDSPMIFSLGFLITFAVGGFGGIILASIPIDLHITNTYFVVGHMHYVLFGGSVMAIFAAIYFWFPKMTGYKLNEKLALWHFGFTFIGSNLTFLPMHWLGMLGMPRRVADYDPLYANDNLMASIGGAIMGFGTLFLVANYFLTLRKKERCAENPWNSKGLEWTHASSPPAANNFDEIPIVTTDPYDYGVLTPPKAAKEAKAHG
jgi:cytochrome c oxidase subunit 1